MGLCARVEQRHVQAREAAAGKSTSRLNSLNSKKVNQLHSSQFSPRTGDAFSGDAVLVHEAPSVIDRGWESYYTLIHICEPQFCAERRLVVHNKAQRPACGAKRRMVLGGSPADLRLSRLDNLRWSHLVVSSIDVNEEQPLKAPSPRFSRAATCSAIAVIEAQPSKAPLPRLVRPAGSAIDVNEEQP